MKETGQPVATSIAYTNMENYEKMDRFLKACMEELDYNGISSDNSRADTGIC